MNFVKKRLLALISLALCFATVFTLLGCSSVEDPIDTGESSDIATDVSDTEKKTEKKTEKRTEKRTEKPKETDPIPGKTPAPEKLSAKTYSFANMPASQQKLFKMSTRVQPNADGLIFDYTCATIEFQGYMTGDVIVEINSKRNHDYGNSYFTVYVDGIRSNSRFEVQSGKTEKLKVASFKGNYFHTVKIVKQTEFKWSLATIKSLAITGYLINAPKDSNYYIEFLGDSLTAAYGNIGKPGDEPSDSPDYQDGTKSYAYMLADTIGADQFILARSAAGISQCWSNEPILNYYKKLSKNRSGDDFDIKNARKPDLIILHLGANDYNVGGSNRDNFVSKGKELINYFRENYGTDLPIIWAYDPGEGFPSKVKEIMNSFGGESAGYYTVALEWRDIGAGAGGHPNVKAYEAHANILLNLITEKNILD